MSKLIARFAKDESGATAIEYGLIAALVAVAIIVGAGMLGNELNNKFSGIANAVKAAPTP
jgi:pilus assembly protein Flp/PilA